MKRVYFLLFALIATKAISQTVTVLPQDGTYRQNIAPQGAFRYQRQFYLITTAEMAKSGFQNGMAVNSIGFTIGVAQSDSSGGNFKVYLQNTSDAVSRTDTAWTVVSASTNSYDLSGLTPGKYEWQVISVCGGTTVDTANTSFTNNNLSGCNVPTNLFTDSITSTAAKFEWVSPASSVTNYVVQYDSLSGNSWTSDTVSTNYLNVTGLVAGKNYKWRVSAQCASSYSDFVNLSFATDPAAASCNVPTVLSTGSITNTSATISWMAAAGASFYGTQYRRAGTSSWTNGLAFTTSSNITGLKAGTTYEWRVRTVCGVGNGAYVAGTSFTTTGTTACYAPARLSSDSLTDSTAVLSWVSTGAASYTLRYRLKDYITWADATSPMTLVSNDSLTIPGIVGPYDHAFSGGPFTYSGGGLYIGYEYSDSAGTLPTANTSLCTTQNSSLKAVNGQDSILYKLSLGSNKQDTLPGILLATKPRPETRLGSPGMADSVEVSNVYALGNVPLGYGTPTTISALVKNHSSSPQTYTVTLTIKDRGSNAVRHTDNQSVTIPAGSLQIVTFAGWSPTIVEIDSILVSVPAQTGETNLVNNSSYYIQQVTNNILSYEDGTPSISSGGFDTISGLVLTRYSMNGCGKVNGAQIYLSNTAKNHALRAMILNSAGTIVDSSDYFTPDSSQVNSFHSFFFLSPPIFTNADYYIGLAQPADPDGYFPVGVQWEGTDIRSSAYYYRADSTGATLTDVPARGRLMIRAEIVPSSPTVAITGKQTVCASGTDTLKAVSIDTRFANQVLAFSSQNSNLSFSAEQSLGTPNVYPANILTTNDWISGTADGQREYLELGFANPAPVNFIDIYENYNPGAVDTVYVKNPLGNFEAVYTGTAAVVTPTGARINHITFPLTSYNVSQVRIAINSPAVTGYNAIDAVSTGWIDNPAYLPYVSYAWSSGATTQTVYITSAGSYGVAATDSSGCGASASAIIVTPPVVIPTITPNRATVFCTGDTAVKLISSQLTGLLWSTGATTSAITVSTTGTYTVAYNDGSGCGITTSLPQSVTVNPLPVVSVTGNLAYCPGTSTSLNAGAGYSAYKWSTGASVQTISVNTSSTFVVTVTDANGCKGKATVVTSVAPVPSPVITGASSFCQGSSTTLNAGSGYSTYSWSTGATTSTISVNTAATYNVTVTNSSSCSGSTSFTTHFFTPPSPFISGNASFCPGSSTVITANTGYSSYSWSTGSTSQSITVNSAATYTVIVTGTNGCTGSAAFTTSFFPQPTPVISGNLQFCNGGSTLLDAGVGYASYNWSTGANSHAITVSTLNTFRVTITDNNGCTGFAVATTAYSDSTPHAPSAIVGQATGLCNAVGKKYSVAPVATATFYQWTIPAGDSIVSGQGTDSITVIFGNFVVGTISVVASNTCGQSPQSILQVSGAPSVPGSISGLVTVCRQNGVVYSISAQPGATTYTWSVPAGATIASGQGTNSITVNFGTGFSTTGSICVTAGNACGASASSCLTVNAKPPVPAAIIGPSAACKKQANVLYHIAPIAGATTYTWTIPPGAKINSGQGTTAISVTFANQTGSISVRTENACGYSNYLSLPVVFTCRDSGTMDDELSFSAYPNPTHDMLNVKFSSNTANEYVLQLIDSRGRVVVNEEKKSGVGVNSLQIDLANFSKGIYILSLTTNQGINRLRVVVE